MGGIGYEKDITYPTTRWVEYQKKTKYEYGLNNNIYRYIAKYSSRSFHTAAEAGANYTTMPYSNFPVHLSTYPKANLELINNELEEKMDLVKNLVTLGRASREATRI